MHTNFAHTFHKATHFTDAFQKPLIKSNWSTVRPLPIALAITATTKYLYNSYVVPIFLYIGNISSSIATVHLGILVRTSSALGTRVEIPN